MGSTDCFIQRYTCCLLFNFRCDGVCILPSFAYYRGWVHFSLQGYKFTRRRDEQGQEPDCDADDDFAFGILTRSTDIVLVKSCRDVEGKYFRYLSFLCKKQIVCTGPLIADANHYDDKESNEIMKWLSGKNDGSTIYISFGSECLLSKKQIAEIAKGLLLCEVNFLWVIRFPVGEKTTNIEEELPKGFLEKVKERGLVVSGWAPQTEVLGHPSIAGFVSHCGWSSIMESMYYGVPVITMPMKSEQSINAQLVVENIGVGVEVQKGGNGVYVGEEVAKAINKVMVEKTFYEGMRNRTRKLSETMREKEEGEMNEAAEQLWRICTENKLQNFCIESVPSRSILQ